MERGFRHGQNSLFNILTITNSFSKLYTMAMIFINAICKCSRMEIMHMDLWHREIVFIKLFFLAFYLWSYVSSIFYSKKNRTCSSDAVDKEFAFDLLLATILIGTYAEDVDTTRRVFLMMKCEWCLVIIHK